MATWRLASAETLVVGDALMPFVSLGKNRSAPDAKVAVEALRGIALVRAVAADLVPPGLAVRAILAGDRAATAEAELSLLGRGDVRRVVWVVESATRGSHLRRAVDAYTGEILSGLPGDLADEPGAIVLTRAGGPAACDLVTWSSCVLGLPLSVELEPPARGQSWCPAWQQVVGAVRGPVPV